MRFLGDDYADGSYTGAELDFLFLGCPENIHIQPQD